MWCPTTCWSSSRESSSSYIPVPDLGAGKTASMVMAGMELRRLGLTRRPAYVVPNHMLEQFSREFLQLYPSARSRGRQDRVDGDGRHGVAPARPDETTGLCGAQPHAGAVLERVPPALSPGPISGPARPRRW